MELDNDMIEAIHTITEASKKTKFNLVHLSTGDILRVEIKAATELGLHAKYLIDQGKLVPDDIVINIQGDSKMLLFYHR